MSVFHNNMLVGASQPSGPRFDTTLIANSVWMDGSSDGFTRAASNFTNQTGKEFTLGTWFQLTEFGVTGAIFCAGDSSAYTSVRHDDDNKIYFQTKIGNAILKTQAVFVDINWYHLLVSVDTTQGTNTDRVRIFVNGVQQTLDGTFPAQDRVYDFDRAEVHEVGDSIENGPFEGYLAQSFMIGSKSVQQGDFSTSDFLDTFTFGTNGSQVIPKAHSEIKTLVDAGSSNSYLLQYENSGALGTDSSTNTHTFTATSMDGANQTVHSPSLSYPIFNELAPDFTNGGTWSEGNTKIVSTSEETITIGTLPPVSTGKYYWEWVFTDNASSGNCRTGMTPISHWNGKTIDPLASGDIFNADHRNSLFRKGSTTVTSILGSSGTYALCFDLDAGKVWVGLVDTSDGSISWYDSSGGTTGDPANGNNPTATFTANTAMVPFAYVGKAAGTSWTMDWNFGQFGFGNSAVPTGFEQITSAKVTSPDFQGIDFFNPVTYTGISGGTLVSRSLGSPIGNMTSGGGLASAFDGVVQSSHASAAYSNSTSGNIGKDFGSGVTKTITGVVVKMLGSLSVDGGAGTETMTLTVERSDNGTDFTQIFTESSISVAAGAVITKRTGFSNTAAARYARISISHSGGAETHVSELEFYADGSATNAVTGVGFQPDWVWIKDRETEVSHALYDSVRGTTKQIETDLATAETTENQGLTAFGSDGFTLGTLDQVNAGGKSFISWNWLAGGSASSNGSGSITSSVSAAASGHFSIVGWTGNTTAGATVGHGLGGAPEFIIAIARNESGENKPVYHKFMTADTDHLKINETNAQGTAGTTIWDESAMSSTLIGLGAAAQSNSTNGMIAYCFRSVPGVCQVGTYEGNNDGDGSYVALGFRPAWFMVKNIDATGGWFIIDTKRGFNSPANEVYLRADDDQTETTGNVARILSDGIKWNTTGGGNASNTFIYLAMADIGGNGTLPPIYGR